MLDLDKGLTSFGPDPIVSVRRVLCPGPDCGRGCLRLRYAYPDRSGQVHNCFNCGLFSMEEDSMEESLDGEAKKEELNPEICEEPAGE